jgi:hypothetical protein
LGAGGPRFKSGRPDHSSFFALPKIRSNGFLLCRHEVYTVGRAVQEHGFQQLAAFGAEIALSSSSSISALTHYGLALLELLIATVDVTGQTRAQLLTHITVLPYDPRRNSSLSSNAEPGVVRFRTLQ